MQMRWSARHKRLKFFPPCLSSPFSTLTAQRAVEETRALADEPGQGDRARASVLTGVRSAVVLCGEKQGGGAGQCRTETSARMFISVRIYESGTTACYRHMSSVWDLSTQSDNYHDQQLVTDEHIPCVRQTNCAKRSAL